MVPLVRRGGEQEQVPAMGAKGFCQLEVLGLARLLAGFVNTQMMGLVEYHKVPRGRFQKSFYSNPSFKCIHGDDQPVVLGEGI